MNLCRGKITLFREEKITMVQPKKKYGQHFLKDRNIAGKIVQSLTGHHNYDHILEVGPGTGILTGLLFELYPNRTKCIDIDTESIAYLHENYPGKKNQILEGDFLTTDLDLIFPGKMGIIGNFPYNISSQIFFRIFDYQFKVEEVVGMLQKEVAERISTGPGSRAYGILSVILRAYYDIEYLFTVEPGVFRPPPKVRSAVIRLRRNEVNTLPCEKQNLLKIVKRGFQNRRKTLRNALKGLNLPGHITEQDIFSKRAEQLSVDEFIDLTLKIESVWNK